MDQKKRNRLINIALGSCVPIALAGMITGIAYIDPPVFNKLKNDVIVKIGGNYAYNYFTKSLKKKEVYERSQAAERLGQLDRKDAVPYLKSVLEDSCEDIQVKKAAAISVRKLMPNQYFKEKFGDSLNNDRKSLVSIIQKTLDNLPHKDKLEETGEYTDLYKEKVHNYTEKFERLNEEKRLDLVNLNIISKVLDELKTKDTLTKIGELVKADIQSGEVNLEGVREDGTYGPYTVNASKTELGGLVKIVEKKGKKRLVFENHEPIDIFNHWHIGNDGYKINDAVCSFHLHATNKVGDSEFAGPSFIFGDLSSAYWTSRDGILITYLGTDEKNRIQVNIDYYTRNWVVVDLGNYDTGVELKKDYIVIDSYEFNAEEN